ncbi:hypothetical protein B484DRAFT_422558 [Ochromonadaceae sp. CCMP2298]|nr:hypothetical protein B484DRAFT_422558 [Ochromonadaceae sp. CCMP2298]
MAGLFLGLVKRALTAEPSADSLLTLLQLADPDLTLQDIKARADRDRLIKQLRLAVHPDRQDAKDDATGVFQQMTIFNDRCANLPAGNSTESVKKELVTSGPVLSTTFQPSATTIAIDAAIYGWRLRNGVGEVWLVRVEEKTAEVPLGTCSLLDDVQIPAYDLHNTEWQHHILFPYIEKDFKGRDWLTYTTCDLNFTSNQVVQLRELLGVTGELCIGRVLGEKRQIEVCQSGMKALSRRAEITEMVLKFDKPGSITLRINFL